MKKLFIAAAVIVMAGSMASCGQKTQKAAQDTAEQVEAVEIEAVTPESEIPAAAESQKTQPEQANNK